MARSMRIVVPGGYHHVVQRGNNKQEVFHGEADYKKYCAVLRLYSNKHECKVGAYCLMPNHVHLLVRPPEKDNLAAFMKCVNVAYQHHLNETTGFVGHVWQGRYYSAPVEEGADLWTVCAYIDKNPLRAAMVADPCDYPFSSAVAHEQGKRDYVLTDVLFEGRDALDYGNTLHSEELNKRDLERIRLSTQKGHPIGGSAFKRIVEMLIGRPLIMRPSGRPRLAP
jgi:putative transposase